MREGPKKDKREILRSLHHVPSLRETLQRMSREGRISAERAAHVGSRLDEWVAESRYILLNLGVHIGMGFVRFTAIPLPLPVGSLLRVIWVTLNRIYCDIKWDMKRKEVHSMVVFFFAAIPFLGYFAYTIPLKKKSEYLTYLYAEHVSYKIFDRPFEEKLEKAPRPIRRLASALLVPAELRRKPISSPPRSGAATKKSRAKRGKG